MTINLAKWASNNGQIIKSGLPNDRRANSFHRWSGSPTICYNTNAIWEISVDTYVTAKNMMANDPSRWVPKTHETADHSLPYVVSMALLDGAIDADSFSGERLADPRMAALMARITVSEDAALTAQHPEASPSRIALRLKDGREIDSASRYSKGHAGNPMDAAEVEDKFRRLFTAYHGADRADRMIALVGDLDGLDDIADLFAGFAR